MLLDHGLSATLPVGVLIILGTPQRQGISTSRGGQWSPMQVSRVLAKLEQRPS